MLCDGVVIEFGLWFFLEEGGFGVFMILFEDLGVLK